MNYLEIFKRFIERSKFTPAKLGQINTLIFHEWNEKKAREIFPEDLVKFISSIQGNEVEKDNIYHILLPENLRTE